jgi:hypothetical protein
MVRMRICEGVPAQRNRRRANQAFAWGLSFVACYAGFGGALWVYTGGCDALASNLDSLLDVGRLHDDERESAGT